MKYKKIIKGQFIDRPNRFIALVEIGGKIEKAHVKNTGRCKELLVPGADVYLEDFENRMGKRKLRYSLIAVEKITEKGALLINMDSQAPNKVALEALSDGKIVLPGMKNLSLIKPETTYGDSRFDFYLEDVFGKKAFAEVKGVTLENHGIARFPDAPTLRGVKHIEGLKRAVAQGYGAYIIMIIQMKGMKEFQPNDETHPEFGMALRSAVKAGVKVLSYDCEVREDILKVNREIKVELDKKEKKL